MAPLGHRLRHRLGPWLRPIRDLGRKWNYLFDLFLGHPSGHISYHFCGAPLVGEASLQIWLPTEEVDSVEVQRWCEKQTLADSQMVVGEAAGDAAWFYAPGKLPALPPAFLESAFLVAAAEEIDAVVLWTLFDHPPLEAPSRAEEAAQPKYRPWAIFRSTAWHYDPESDQVTPRSGRRLVKVIDGPPESPRTTEFFGRLRRGSYFSSAPLPPILAVGLRDVALLREGQHQQGQDGEECAGAAPELPVVIVMQSFLAHGGAEHTLYEALSHLTDQMRFVFVTLAPHAPERGDRRGSFRQISESFYSLGDLVHPAAMEGILVALIRQTGARTLFNNNGTTLFYDLAPRLKARVPDLRIIDHLYDHRIGYITWYDAKVREAIDVCIAENRPIHQELVENRGWTPERVPVIWPCGRRREEFPAPDEIPATRRRLREELGFDEDDIVFLTAARMNFQKRPLDLVRLAERVTDLSAVRFLIVGGGELEGEVDAAVASARQQGVKVSRAPFRDDIPALLTACDVGCLVSEFEGLPVFMMESFQAGLPFLGTDVGDLGAVLRETGAGIVVDRPGDLDALEEAVRTLADPVQRAAFAAKTPTAAKLFEPAVCARRYGKVLAG